MKQQCYGRGPDGVKQGEIRWQSSDVLYFISHAKLLRLSPAGTKQLAELKGKSGSIPRIDWDGRNNN